MGDLTIRRNRGFAAPQYQGVGKTEKQAGVSQSQSAAKTPAPTVPEGLRQLMTMGGQAASRRTLQAGEAVLAEIQDKLSRLAELAREASDGGDSSRDDLQGELDQLRGEIDRILRSVTIGDTRLFLSGDTALDNGAAVMLYAAASEQTALPNWLMKSLFQGSSLTAEQLLSGLGLDKTASSSELMAAIANSSLEGNSSAGYLAALYLGAVIAGGKPSEAIDPEEAMEGLRQLLEEVAGGVPADQAIEELSNGAFSSLADFESQFTGGTAPGLQAFLVNLLLSDSSSALLGDISFPPLLAGLEGANLELLMGVLTASQNSDAPSEAAAGINTAEIPEAPNEISTAKTLASPAPAAALQFGNVQITGQDLSGISFDESTGVLTVGGHSDIVIQGAGQGGQAILITGSGTVTMHNVHASILTIDTPEARIFSAGENVLAEVQLSEGASPSFGGSGLLYIGALRANESNTLRLTGGAVVLAGESSGGLGVLTIPVVLDGPVSLAAQADNVRNSGGKLLEPFDLVWKALVPGWSGITAMALDGRQARMALFDGDVPSLARLWMEKGNSSHGYTIHTLTIRGRDPFGNPKTRYAYLHWSQSAGCFEELSMYPNPFSVTGGEENRDWIYEEETHTLHILSNQVTAVSGGSGTDAKQTPFSGKIALADCIGATELTLSGVVCRVSSGRAFHLGRANDVTLLLQGETNNYFESGAGCAGISLGNGTSLRIDCTASHGGDRNSAGTLTASGGDGGAGIGRDSGVSQDRTSRILICGGVITATGAGGGAGIGAGKRGAIGPVTITGGTVTSTGGQGGAGIGGSMDAPVGDICIHGGAITAAAVCHAAAIGAGLRGTCGDILIAGTARIVKALGGDPGADIGPSLFGSCGKVHLSDGVGISLQAQAGIPLQMGDGTAMLPQFRLSSGTLRLDGLRLSDRKRARDAAAVIEAGQRLVAQIQTEYRALYSRLEQRATSKSARTAKARVRDAVVANTLLEDMRQSIPLPSSQAVRTHGKQGKGNVQQLLR